MQNCLPLTLKFHHAFIDPAAADRVVHPRPS